MPLIRTTINPGVEYDVSDTEYERLLDLGLIYDGTPPVAPVDAFDARMADRIDDADSLARAALDAWGADIGGAVASVNGETGDVVLSAADVGAATPADVTAASTADRDRANHTGTQAMTTLTETTGQKIMTAAERTKLTGVATGATANSTDATLLARANHTGTQPSATLSDLTETVQDIVAALLVAGTNVTTTYDDVANTFTINATATGGTTDPEIVRDTIGGALVAGSGITITVNDAGDTITIASTAVLPTRQVISGTGLTGGGDLSANRTLAVSYGTAAGTAVQGNDTRVTADQAAATASIRTLGTGAAQAKPGNWTPTVADVPAGAMLSVVQNGDGTWPNRLTSRTDVRVTWIRVVAGSADPAAATSPAVTGAYTADVVIGA